MLMNAKVAVENLNQQEKTSEEFHKKTSLTIKVKDDIDYISLIEKDSNNILKTVNSSTQKIEVPGSISFNEIGYNNYVIEVTYSNHSVDQFPLKLDPMIPYYP